MSITRTLALSGFLMTAVSAPAMAGITDNKVVYDRNGNVIHSELSGECVRTNWEAGHDPCAPAPRAEEPRPAPQPVAVMSPARTLQMEDRTIYFEFDQSRLTAEARSRLDNLANVLKSSSDVKHATIVGHADRLGDAKYNVKLSEKRANEVKRYLADRGYINTQVAEVHAVGADQQVKACAGVTPRAKLIECLAPNRRVHLDITYAQDRNVYHERPVSYNQPDYRQQ